MTVEAPQMRPETIRDATQAVDGGLSRLRGRSWNAAQMALSDFRAVVGVNWEVMKALLELRDGIAALNELMDEAVEEQS